MSVIFKLLGAEDNGVLSIASSSPLPKVENEVTLKALARAPFVRNERRE